MSAEIETPSSPRAGFDSITVDSLEGMIPLKVNAVPAARSEAPAGDAGESIRRIPSPTEPTEAHPEAKEGEEPPPPPGKPVMSRHKTIKAWFDEGEPTDYREDAKIEYKVNGTTVRKTLREILDGQSSIENTDRYYAQKKKEIESREREWGDYLKNIMEQSRQGKGLHALVKAMADQGADPIEFMRGLRTQLANEASKWSSLTDEQKKLIELEEELNYSKSRLETQAEASKREQEEQQLLQVVSQVEQQFGMPEGSWRQWYEVLQEEQQAGRVPPGDITIQQVGEFYRGTQAYVTVSETLKSLAPHVASDKEVISDLLRSYQTHGLSKEDLEDVVRELYPATPSEEEKPANGFDAERAGRNLAEKLATSPKSQSQTPSSDKETGNRTVKRARQLW